MTADPSTIALRYRVDRREIAYLRFTFESYGGMAVVGTLDPFIALIEVRVAPGCEKMVRDLISSLRRDEGLKIEEVPGFEP